MPGGFWDDLDIYERGGVAGPRGTGAIIDQVPADATAAPPVPAGPPEAQPFDPMQQVGHNGAINGMTREQYRDAWQGSGVTNNAGLDSWLAQHGGRRLNDSGVVTTPFGEQIDMGTAFKTGNGSAGWGGVGGSSAAQAPRGGPGDGAAMPTSPYGFGGGGGGGAVGAGSTVGQPGHLAGSFQPFTYENFNAPAPFQAPTAEQAQADPGFQFGLTRGLDAMSNRATAQGIRGGDVLKGFNDYANDYASQKYTDVYNRARDTYGLNVANAFQANQANNAGRLGGFQANTNADLGYGNLNVANRNVDLGYTRAGNDFSLGQGQLALGNKTADQNYALGQGNLGLGYYSAGNNFALGQGQQALGWANYGLGANQQQFFQDYQFPMSTGFDAARSTGGYGSIYAQNSGNNAVGNANAQGAAGMAGANAWNQGFNNAGNAAMDAYYWTHPQSGG